MSVFKIRYEVYDFRDNQLFRRTSDNPSEGEVKLSEMNATLPRQDIRRRRSERTEDMRKRILEESVKLFLEQGYEKTTTRQILQRVGILNGSLYNIYKSKEEIFSDIIMISLMEVSDHAPEVTSEEGGWVDRVSYVLCMELYLSKQSSRVAELLSLLNVKQAIRDRVYSTVLSWSDGTGIVDGRFPLMTLDSLTGVTSALIQRMVTDPDAVDLRRAMEIVVGFADCLFGIERRDVGAVVDAFEENMSGHTVTICGTPIL